MSEVRTLLGELPRIQSLSTATLDALARDGRLLPIPQGWTPIHDHEPADKAYVVVEGRLSVVRDDATVAEIGPGEFAGEMGLVDHRLRNAQLTAAGPVRVLAWTATEFQDLREHHPEFDQLVRASARARHEQNDAQSPQE